MKKLNIPLFIILLAGCSDPNQPYIDAIQQEVRDDAMGIDINYKNETFRWIDTLFISDLQQDAVEAYEGKLNELLNFEYFVSDNFTRAKILSLSYITKSRLNELRNWERNVGHRSFDGDYYKFAYDNRNASPFLSQLCSNLDLSDSLLENYKELQEGNIDLLRNVTWYYSRIDKYKNGEPSPVWSQVNTSLNALADAKIKSDSLSKLNGSEVVHYKAFNQYLINNPVLGGTEVQVKRNFLFTPKFEVIGHEDVD